MAKSAPMPRRRFPIRTDADLLSGLTVAELVSLTGTHRTTATRWKHGNPLPEPVRRLLAIVAHGELDQLGFRRWRIVAGHLYSPEGWEYSPGEILALTLLRQQLASLQAKDRAFKAMTAQPEPGHDVGQFGAGRSRA